MEIDLTQVTGISASIFTGISLLPQLLKILKEKNTKELSPIMLGVLFTGLALWVYYGALKNDWIIIVSNAFSLLINAAIIICVIRYRNSN